MRKIFIVLGVVLIAIGILWPYLKRLGIGQLPGDFIIKREHFSFYFPLTTCIIASIILSLLFWFLNR